MIGLREGLEAALIVGIVAAFLRQERRTDALRWVWLGIAAAIAICGAVAILLELASRSLPQKQQEGLETVVGAVAVVAVTFMVVWMRRNARALKGTLERDAARALSRGSTWALVAMAFFAVVREGFETAVFLLAAFDASTNAAAAGAGAVLGVAVAVVIGYAIYRGGVRINLSRFFRATGVVLVLVAAGLLSTCLRTAHEAGWFDGLQAQALDLRWLVAPGTIRSALLTGMLGLQTRPTVGETLVYVLYALPMLAFVLWPHRRLRLRWRAAAWSATVSAVVALVVLAAACGGGGGTADRTTRGEQAAMQTVAVTLTESGCPARLDLRAGPTTFEVTNDGADAVSEFEVLEGTRILGEVENLAPGLSGRFSLTLDPGRFRTYCPGGDATEHGLLAVSGKGSAGSDAARAAVSRYRSYVRAQAALLVKRTAAFTAAVDRGDVAGAKRLYADTRAPYERIEPVAESFGDLDPAIDARAGDVPARRWTGFHPIEQALWVRSTTDGLGRLTAKLVADVRRLDRLVQTVELEPAQIANGAVELLGEVSKSKITGEEERYSHTDLEDFEANVDGAQAAFTAVRPILAARRPALASQIDERFAGVAAALAPHKSSGRFVLYTSLERADTIKLSRSIDALAEPLSQVGSIVVRG